ncbi:hypothetical protein T11_1670 [Trichinella zimbabwensis]|uniref:Uncharacterized protein n=1 Tax=Trichinella zimbabwensis TaxID=268475 RepID=A0A0V1GC20_9BILA|nr:hypothetical protein T11_1670 [Trichinella zimbabwensis]
MLTITFSPEFLQICQRTQDLMLTITFSPEFMQIC